MQGPCEVVDVETGQVLDEGLSDVPYLLRKPMPPDVTGKDDAPEAVLVSDAAIHRHACGTADKLGTADGALVEAKGGG